MIGGEGADVAEILPIVSSWAQMRLDELRAVAQSCVSAQLSLL